MKKKFLTTFLLLIFNFNLYADEDDKSLRIGLLAPLTGTYSELGNLHNEKKIFNYIFFINN